MKRILYTALALPIGIALIVLSVANRQAVTLRLDPFNAEAPALSVSMPFFAFLFLAVLTGMIAGGLAVWFSQGKHRKSARRERGEARRWREEAEASRKRADELAANLASGQTGASLPAPSADSKAA